MDELKDFVEERPKVEPKPEPKLVAIRAVQSIGGKTALVEWDDGERLRRAYVPPNVITDGMVKERDLKKGVPYGIDWEEFITVTATPESVAMELRRRGIWTLKDYQADPRGVNLAFVRAIGMDVNALRIAADKEAKK